ncbi:MAG: NAD(P)-dependent oxidoreductase [Myxococcota bacterium]|nr:NAD(P)-dependent oxidoreductase [Myxococcota bacterium]
MGSLQGKKIALIGGAGFIGHHLALEAVRRGAQVHVIDGLQVNNLMSLMNDPAVHRDLYMRMVNERLDLMRAAGVELHPQDARDYHALSRILAVNIKPNIIVQLAAVAHAGRSNKDPFSTFDHSLRTLENALDVARSCEQLERFVFLSSSMVYGNFETDSVDEQHPLNPIGIYGALKLGGEKIVIAYNQVFGMPYTIIRPSALYGPRCVSRRVGQVYVESAIAGGKLRVDGDGTERIDFTYIDDLVHGILSAMVHPGAKNETFNLTNGSARSIKELVSVIKESFPTAPVEYVQRDHLMPFRGTLSVDKARRLFDYEPKNPIEVGFPKYIEWYRQFMGLERERAAGGKRS